MIAIIRVIRAAQNLENSLPDQFGVVMVGVADGVIDGGGDVSDELVSHPAGSDCRQPRVAGKLGLVKMNRPFTSTKDWKIDLEVVFTGGKGGWRWFLFTLY